MDLLPVLAPGTAPVVYGVLGGIVLKVGEYIISKSGKTMDEASTMRRELREETSTLRKSRDEVDRLLAEERVHGLALLRENNALARENDALKADLVELREDARELRAIVDSKDLADLALALRMLRIQRDAADQSSVGESD